MQVQGHPVGYVDAADPPDLVRFATRMDVALFRVTLLYLQPIDRGKLPVSGQLATAGRRPIPPYHHMASPSERHGLVVRQFTLH
jgi:hypothetical protein